MLISSELVSLLGVSTKQEEKLGLPVLIKTYNKTIIFVLNITYIFLYIGVIEYCGMEGASTRYHTSGGSRDSLTTGRCTAYSWQMWK